MASELHVDAIKHSGGTSAMTIDSTGRILTPARPAFRARIGSSTGGHGTNGTLVFETEDFDIGGNYDHTNGRFTAPVAGVYWFCFDALTATNTSGAENTNTDLVYVEFQKNGSAFGTRSFMYFTGLTLFQQTINRADIFSLSANDYITVHMGSEHAYSDQSGIYDPVFQGYLIG